VTENEDATPGGPPVPPPVPVEYRRPGSGPPRGHPPTWGQFFAGLGLGTLVSAVFWPASWRAIDQGTGANGVLLFGLPVLKLIGAVTLIALGRRGLGLGLLVSIALGFMIFFYICASNLKI
jgi:hypothetical protein